MANKKASPVKPPIIDLAANKSQKTASNEKIKNKKTTTTQKPNKSTRSPSIIFPAILGTIGGAVLGVIITYSLSFSGLLPTLKNSEANITLNNAISNNSTIITELQKQISTFNDKSSLSENVLNSTESRIEAIEKNVATNIEMMQNIADENNKSINEINEQINILQTDLTAQSNQFADIDTNKIEKQIETFDERLNALAAGASSEGAVKIAASISELKNNEANLLSQINQLKADLDNNVANITDLAKKLEQLNEQIAKKQTEDNLVKSEPSNQQLSLALSTFENAIYSGNNFSQSLAEIKTAMPAIEIPNQVKELAISGLDNPENIIAEFSSLVPTILRATPSNEDADWKQSLLNRSISILAIRPKGEVEGNSPAQLVARIEAALAERDFISANDLINQLPSQMQIVAADIDKQIADFALIQTFAQNIKDKILQQNSTNNGETTQ